MHIIIFCKISYHAHFHVKHYHRFVRRVLDNNFLSGIIYIQCNRSRKKYFYGLRYRQRSIVFEELRSDLRREISLQGSIFRGIKLLSSGQCVGRRLGPIRACVHGHTYACEDVRLSCSLFIPGRISNIIEASVLCTRRPFETAECRPSRLRPRCLGRSSSSLTHANAIINIVRETASATHLRNLESSISDSINLAAISGK